MENFIFCGLFQKNWKSKQTERRNWKKIKSVIPLATIVVHIIKGIFLFEQGALYFQES